MIPDRANDNLSESRASGGWGHGPQTPFFFQFLGKNLPHDSQKNGVWGPWPQPPEALELDESFFAGPGHQGMRAQEGHAPHRRETPKAIP